MRKLRSILVFLTENNFVFSPAKTGSTYVNKVLGCAGHGHSFFIDKVYFFNDVRFSTLVRFLNKYIFLFLLVMKNVICYARGANSRLLIPVRDEQLRFDSLFRDLLIPLMARYYFDDEYRKIHHRDKSHVLEYYKTKLNRNGMEWWLQDHVLALFGQDSFSCFMRDGIDMQAKFGRVCIYVFDIKKFDEEFASKVLGEEVLSVDAELDRNKSSSLWYRELFE